jgi:hypothetical protein
VKNFWITAKKELLYIPFHKLWKQSKMAIWSAMKILFYGYWLYELRYNWSKNSTEMREKRNNQKELVLDTDSIPALDITRNIFDSLSGNKAVSEEGEIF